MTNEELLAKIKAEVERLESIEYPCDNSQQATGFFNALDRMTDFLSTLESEKPMELDEAAKAAATEVYTYTFQGMDDLIGLFKAGAEWQAEKDARDMYMSDNRHFEKVYELGKKDMKEQMMKVAVEGIVYGNGDYTWVAGDIPSQFKYGDKVRIIIVKEDE